MHKCHRSGAQAKCQYGVGNTLAEGISLQVFRAKGAAIIASPPKDGFAVANLGQCPRNPITAKITKR